MLIVRVLTIFSPDVVVLMAMLDIESDSSTVVPFGKTLVHLWSDWLNKCAITAPKSVQFENNCTLFYRGNYKINKYMIISGMKFIPFYGMLIVKSYLFGMKFILLFLL